MSRFDTMKADTEAAVKNPRPGMRFHEMFTHWVYIVAVIPECGLIVTREFSGHPANPPADKIEYHTFKSVEEFAESVKYVYFCDDKGFEAMANEVYATAKGLA